MKNLALLVLFLVGISQAQITYEGGRTQLVDTVRWGDSDDSASSTLARGNANYKDSSGTWVAITTDSCSLPARLSYGTVMPNSKLELSYEVRTSSGNTDSSQVKWRIDGRYCKGVTCETWVPAGRFRGDTSSAIMDSLISVPTASGTTWQPTRQIFDVPGGMQLRLCQDGYKAGSGTNDSTFFRRLVIRNSAIPAGGTPPSSVSLTGDIELSDLIITESVLPTGAATEATLAAASAKLPATLGQKAMAASMAVALASDQAAIPITVASIPSHAVTNAGTFAIQIDGAALTSLQLTDDIVQTEDAAHSDGHKGVQALAVRRDANTTLATSDGDYGPLQLNADGSLKVAITAGAGSGGTSIADDAAFTPASTSVTPIAGFADETSPDLVNEGDAGAVRMTLSRALHVNLRNAAGDELSVGGQYAEDAAHASGDQLMMAGAVRRDAPASSAGTDGDNATLNTDAAGRLWVTSGPAPAATWSYAAAAGGLVNTTGVTVKAAAGAGVRNYVTAIQCINSHQTTGTEIMIRDGAAGTVLWRGWAQAAGGGFSAPFAVPLRTTANTLVEIAEVTTTATAGVLCNLQGYESAQ